MTGEIKTGVRLTLKDQFSKNIEGAGNAVKRFAGSAMKAVNGVDKAFSGVGTALGAIGISFSVGSALREITSLDEKMTSFGTTMGMSTEQLKELKQGILDTVTDPNIKIGTGELLSAIDAISERTGDASFITENMHNIGVAIRATGAAGADMGGLYAEIEKMGISAEDAAIAMSTLAVQGNNGAFVLKDIANLGPRTIAAYTATGRTGAKALIEMGAALQVIRRGTGSSEQAATAFEAVMRNLTSPDKQQKLMELGVTVRDASNEFRPITDIMTDIVEKSQGSLEVLGGIFDSEAVRAFNSAIGEYQKNLKETGEGSVKSFKEFANMIDDGSYLERAAAENSKTLAANLQQVQSAFLKFADSKLTKPLEKLTELLNKLAEDPDAFERIFNGIAIGVASIAAIKGLSGIISLISNLKGLSSSGGNLNIQAGAAGNGMPVYVTNWGGKPGASALPSQAGSAIGKTPTGQNAGTMLNAGSSGSTIQKMAGASSQAIQNITTGQYIAGGALAGLGEAFIAIPNAVKEVSAINDNVMLSKKEKSKEKGGAIGNATGSVAGAVLGGMGGMAAGAAAGAAIGTVIPGIGNIAGLIIGGAVGAITTWAGGKAGRAIGEQIGEAVADDDEVPLGALPYSELPESFAEDADVYTGGQAVLQGNADIGVHIDVSDNRTTARVETVKNTIDGVYLETGSVAEARRMY